MKHHSLQWRITSTTLVILFITAMIAVVATFYVSHQETGEVIDNHLRGVAVALADLDARPQSYYPIEDEDGLWIDIFVNDNDPLTALPMGFSTKRIDDENFKIYHLYDRGRHIIVRERTEVQEDLATLSALHSLLPLLVVSGILLFVLPFVIWYSFRSVQKSTKQVLHREKHDLSKLDITNFPKEILPFANAMNGLLDKAQDGIDTQKRFIADASHELRSPLTAMSLQVQRLQGQTNPIKITQGLDKLAKSISQNQDLVEKLLTIARLDGKTWANTPTELSHIIKNTINLLLPIISDKELEIDVNLQPYQVNIDPTALLLLIKNIIQNAVIYTPIGGKIGISLDQQNKLQPLGQLVIGHGKTLNHEMLLLQIKDSGIGVAADQYQSMFMPFAQLSHDNHSDSSANKGTGLGLSIVKTVCEQANIDLYLAQSTFADHQGGLCVTLVF